MSVAKTCPVVRAFLEVGSRRFPLEKAVSVLGSDAANCDIVIDEPGVSPRHAFIVRKQDSYHLYDFRSHSGTWVNSAAVGQHHRLRPQDAIRIGQKLLGFRVETDEVPSESAILKSLSGSHLDPVLPQNRGLMMFGAAVRKVLPVLYRSCGEGSIRPDDRAMLLAFCDLARGTLDQIGEPARS